MKTSLALSLATAVAAAMGAVVVIATWEAIAAGSVDVGVLSTLLPIAALYTVPALGLGVASGVFLWCFRAEFGAGALPRLYRRLADDRDAEARALGAVFAAFAVALVLAGASFVASIKLVAGVERKGVGAMLAAVAVVLALPIAAAAALPAYRTGVACAKLVPRIGPILRPLVVLLAIAALGALATLWIATTKLDWRALPIGAALAFGVLGVVFVGLYVAIERLASAKAVLITGAIALLVGVANIAASTSPSPAVATAVTKETRGAGLLVRLARARIDGDGDGFSAFFAGPDCDDTNPHVRPGAVEIPDNGIDDNCEFGDRVSAAPSGDARPDAGQLVKNRPPPADNLLLIVVDTLRADRLGVAGYRRDGTSLTPNLDAFAATAANFTRVYAQAPNTPRSFPSFFTSQYPSQVAVDKVFANYSNVLPENTTLFEVLAGAGIETVGISSHFYFTEERGIRQGFAEYDNEGAKDIAGSNKDIASPRTVPKAIAKLNALADGGKRFALFVHLFEPHSTYVTHPEYPITESGEAALRQKYDYEIKFVDIWIGKLLAALAASKASDRTLVVIASDHGEAFGVHRVDGTKMFFHGQTLYDELLRVPLLVRTPGGEPNTADDVAMMIDVAPTVVDLLGVAIPDAFVGRSLAPVVFGDSVPRRPAFAELLAAPSWKRDAKAMVTADGKHKALYSITDGRWEIYALDADPTEERDLATKEPELAARLKDELGRFIEVDLPRR